MGIILVIVNEVGFGGLIGLFIYIVNFWVILEDSFCFVGGW